MPVFDPNLQRVCVRVVYDGGGGAGKTTNLRVLCDAFSRQHARAFESPGELGGKTLYFDWLEILAGSVCGLPLTCQVVSVPGQAVFTPRRRHLLESADVIVFVCDSSPAGVEAGRGTIEALDDLVVDRQPPLVVQANKQDQNAALTGAAIAATLGRGAPVVEAIATDAIGVMDTFITAVRSVSRAMQAEAEAGTLRLAVRRAESSGRVLARLLEQRLDPEWAAELLLEEAQTAMLLGGGVADPALLAGAEREIARPALPAADAPSGFVWPADIGREVLKSLGAPGDRPRASPAAADEERTEYTTARHVLRTSRAMRFVDREDARRALVSAARERTQLGDLLPPDTVLCAQPASDGAWWIWTITSRTPTIGESMQGSAAMAPGGVGA